MTYGEIYKEFCDKFPNADVKDYRPSDPMYIPQLSREIPNAITLWLNDGSMVVYIRRRCEIMQSIGDIMNELINKQIED